MDRRTWALAVAIWATVVLLVSVVTWTVIDSAGRTVLADPVLTDTTDDEVTSARPPSTETAPRPERTARERRATTRPAERASARRRDTTPRRPASTPARRGDSPTPVGTAATSPSPDRTRLQASIAGGRPAPNRGPSSGPSAGPDREPSPKPPPPPPPPRERSWQGEAGTVTVRCVGPRISLLSASPANGWRMEVDDRGPSAVKVVFEEAESFRAAGAEAANEPDDDLAPAEVEVRSRCSDGAPVFLARD